MLLIGITFDNVELADIWMMSVRIGSALASGITVEKRKTASAWDSALIREIFITVFEMIFWKNRPLG